MTPDFRIVPIEEIIPLRQAVIIAGTKRDNPYFDGDGEPSTFHMGAFMGDACLCCASFMLVPLDGEPAWQLRGMATHLGRRRKGLGLALIAYAEAELDRLCPGWDFWCNSREAAVPFYERAGFEIISEPFVIENIGVHYKMRKRR